MGGMEELPKTGGCILKAVWFSLTKRFKSIRKSCIPNWWSTTQMSPKASWRMSLTVEMIRGGVPVFCKSCTTWFSQDI